MNDVKSENMTIEVDHEKRRLLFTQRGPLDKVTAIQSYHLIHEVEGFGPGYDTLVDYRGITELNLGVSDLMDILSEAKEIEQRTGRAALVVGQDTGRYIFTKLFCALTEKFGSAKVRYMAFQTIEEAEQWLQ